jgi:hypothetical protein
MAAICSQQPEYLTPLEPQQLRRPRNRQPSSIQIPKNLNPDTSGQCHLYWQTGDILIRVYIRCLSRIEKSQILTDRNVTKSLRGGGVELDDNKTLI